MTLPAAVAGSGVGAAAAAAEAIRSSEPDPQLDKAIDMVDELLHAGRRHGLFIDWCVGVFRRASSGYVTVVVSSEGAGYLPRGTFVAREVHMLFEDPGLSREFRCRWFSAVNPAETMLAYADHVSGVAELHALAVSTQFGGTAAPARAAGIPHVAECSYASSPFAVDAPSMPLDAGRQHRLETIDAGLYARLTGCGPGPRPDRSEAWRTTTRAAEIALGRAGAVPDLTVPPEIRQVLAGLHSGVPPRPEQWSALTAAAFEFQSSRPALVAAASSEAIDPRVRATHDLARLLELILYWRPDSEDGPHLKYTDIAYVARQIEGVAA